MLDKFEGFRLWHVLLLMAIGITAMSFGTAYAIGSMAAEEVEAKVAKHHPEPPEMKWVLNLTDKWDGDYCTIGSHAWIWRQPTEHGWLVTRGGRRGVVMTELTDPNHTWVMCHQEEVEK